MRLVLAAVATAFLVLGVEATGATAKVTAPTLAGAQPAPADDSAPPASESDGKVVEVRTGVATLDALLKTGTVTRDHDVYVLHQPVNVRPGATLHLDGAKLLLAGGPEPASILVGGTFTATNTTISGGDGPRADRAEIIVRAGGALVLRSSLVDRLGASEDHPGITVRGAEARASISGTTIDQNVQGLFAIDAGRISLRGTTISRSLTSGVVVHGSCQSLSVRDTVVTASQDAGISLDTTCATASVFGSTADRNGGSGLEAQGSTSVQVSGLSAWGNVSGVTVRDAAVVDVSSGTLSANRQDGITMIADTGKLRVVRSRIDHNIRAGISIASGATTVGPGNMITGNDVGVRLVTGASSVSASGNTVERNVRDGFSLATLTGITIQNNRIVDNGDASFSVATAGDANQFIASNILSATPPIERTRAADQSDAQ